MKQFVSAEKIKNIILPALELQDVDLVDVELQGRAGNQILKIFIDREDGVSLDLCALVSREISDILDTDDIIKTKYRLEVSSPGFNRLLKTFRDFKRNLNRKIKVEYLNESNEKVIIAGTIQSVNKSEISLQSEKETVQILLEDIQSAKILSLW